MVRKHMMQKYASSFPRAMTMFQLQSQVTNWVGVLFSYLLMNDLMTYFSYKVQQKTISTIYKAC